MAENTATATDTATKVSYKVVRITRAEMLERKQQGKASFSGGNTTNDAMKYAPNASYSGQFDGDGARESDGRFYALCKGPSGNVRASYPESLFDTVAALEIGDEVRFKVVGNVIDNRYLQWAELDMQPVEPTTPATEA